MKLTTDIKPRKDGEVTASVPGTPSVPGASYRFADKDGRLVADVAHDAHVAYLLDTGNFYPADEGDIDAGIAVIQGEESPGEDYNEGDDPAPTKSKKRK